jgi:hypothetical protein
MVERIRDRQTLACSFCILLRGADESSSFTRGGPDETEARDHSSRRGPLDLAFASPNLKFNKLWNDFWWV